MFVISGITALVMHVKKIQMNSVEPGAMPIPAIRRMRIIKDMRVPMGGRVNWSIFQ